jgi:hypothetical protein
MITSQVQHTNITQLTFFESKLMCQTALLLIGMNRSPYPSLTGLLYGFKSKQKAWVFYVQRNEVHTEFGYSKRLLETVHFQAQILGYV